MSGHSVSQAYRALSVLLMQLIFISRDLIRDGEELELDKHGIQTIDTLLKDHIRAFAD